MQWSSRSAGVRPSRIMQCFKLRTFAISLVIGLVTIRSPASGFTMRRIEPSGSTSDLETDGSSLLEVRYDLQPKTDSTTQATISNATINSSNIIVTNMSEIPMLNTSEKYENDPKTSTTHKATNDQTTTAATSTVIIQSRSAADDQTTPAATSTVIIQSRSAADDQTTTAATSTVIIQSKSAADDQTTTAATSTVIIQSRSVDQNVTFPVTSWNEQSNDKELTTDTISEKFQNDSTELPVTVNSRTEQTSINTSQSLKYNEGEGGITENMDIITTTEDTHTSSSGNDNTSNLTETLQATQESTSNKFNLKVIIKSSNDTVEKSPSNLTSDITTDSGSVVISESPTVVEESLKVTMIDFTTDTSDPYLENNNPTTTGVPIEEIITTETMKDEPAPYTSTTRVTTFEKKPTINENSTENTLSDISMTTLEPGRIALEKVLNNTPIPSLIELKNLLATQEHTTKLYETEINVNNASKSENSTMQKIDNSTDTVTSKRGGYIDNTETTSSKSEEATTAQYMNIDSANDTEHFGSMYEAEGSEGEVNDAFETKNATGLESQSQLAEDAIKEELLMEKTLHEHEYIKKAHLPDEVPSSGVTTPFPDVTPTMQEVITEDVLSVKPINIEQKKSTIYSLSPYKPLKKLDIQPPKPKPDRDPDDNSWRNESISSLGIVFKPKNASKSFTDVLKNKTTEISKSDKKFMNQVPDLRVRLEKIAEVRKSKKKKINIYGDSVYVDYDESSIDNSNIFKGEFTSPMSPLLKPDIFPTSTLSPSYLTTDNDVVVNYNQKENFKMFKNEFSTPRTSANKKTHIFKEYYDGDDYDAEYVTKIDLKKFSTTTKPKHFRHSSQGFVLTTQKPYPTTYMPGRQPTLQYFPPTKKYQTTVRPEGTQKVNIDEYDDQFKNKVNQFAYTQPPKSSYDSFFGTVSPVQTTTFDQQKQTANPRHTPSQNDEDLKKSLYLTGKSRSSNMHGGFAPSDGNINKASYVIKHYKDFIDDAVKDSEDDHLHFTVAPIEYVKLDTIDKLAQKEPKRGADYDYSTQFRKDIVNRFVDNFNQNSDKFKVNFPIINNNSVVHRTDENGHILVAPRTFTKRLYETVGSRSDFPSNVKPCDANCESMRVVDLSPAYELHYYVPDQEEKEQIEPTHNLLPYRFRL